MDMGISSSEADQRLSNILDNTFTYLSKAVHSIEDEYVHNFMTVKEHGAGGIFNIIGLGDYTGSPNQIEKQAVKDPTLFTDLFTEIQNRVSNDMQTYFFDRIGLNYKNSYNDYSYEYYDFTLYDPKTYEYLWNY